MFKIAIPQPCHENWQKMTPTAKGAFCKSCAKEVVDFTKMTDEQVQNYLLDRTHEKLCGRFQPQQLSRIELYIPSVVFTQNIASWKKYLAIVLLAFGTMLVGCDVKTDKHLMGEPAFTTGNRTETVTVDSAYATVGVMLMPVTLDTTDIVCEPTKGEIAMEPDSNFGVAGGIQLIETDSLAMPVEDILEVVDGFKYSENYNDSLTPPIEKSATDTLKLEPFENIFTGTVHVSDKTPAIKMTRKSIDSLLLKSKQKPDSSNCNNENYW